MTIELSTREAIAAPTRDATAAPARVAIAARKRPARIAAALVVLGFLCACSGGGDGSVGVGSGQDPDPVALDFPIAYTKGPLFDEDMQRLSSTDLRELQRFNVGTDLYLLDRASPTAVERNVTLEVTQGLGDVAGVEISADGTSVLFAMRGPFDPGLADEDQPSWNIWEYDIPSASLRRIIASDITAEAGQDRSPHYLPDGRIIFTSTRQRQAKAILLDEGKPQFDALEEDRDEPAYVLHVMNDDGSDLHQVSFNQSHDYEPAVLDDGRVLFSRWDRAGNANGIHLYTMNPDGTDLQLLYGAESHDSGTDGGEAQFINAREMPDGRIMAIVRPFDQPELGGDAVAIDVRTYVENAQPAAAHAGMAGPAQVSASPVEIRTDLLPSAGGRVSSAFPLWDGTERVLVSWSICRLLEEGVTVPCTAERLAGADPQPAPPLYGIWMYEPRDGTQLPIVVGEEGMMIGDVVAAQPRTNPQAILDGVPGADFDPGAEEVGILNIRSVYDVDGVDTADPDIEAVADPMRTSAAERPARFLRVVKAVSIPDEDVVDLDNTAFGPNARQGMREIVGYAPIEPDGSVRVKVPANVPLAVSVTDANGRRISARHQNWLQLRPGEEVTCNGCHDPRSGLSHGRGDSFDSMYAGAPGTGVPFPNTIPSGAAAVIPDFGETMAEARTRASCQSAQCAALDPSMNLMYSDVWTDPDLRAPDPDAVLAYPPALAPTSSDCLTGWHGLCRIVIHYETHIHPLWGFDRRVLDEDGVTVLADHTCAQSGCHAPVDAMDAVAVPAAQLDLTDGLSPDEMDHFNAYRELLFGDLEQEVVNGALQDRVEEVGVDEDGNPILVNFPVDSPMSAAGARASDGFFSMFDAGGVHEGYLDTDELRLIAEWLDIGAQYYNDPFAVPAD